MGLFDKLKKQSIRTPEERRKHSNEIIKKMGIVCFESLPMTTSSNEIQIKSIDEICKRAVACLISIQFAGSIAQGEEYYASRAMAVKALANYGVENDLLPKEKKIFDENQVTKQDVIDVIWEYELYWVLIWALNLITDKEINPPEKTCNSERASAIIFSTSRDYQFFREMSKLRNVEAILDMADLYYRYHWACLEKKVNHEAELGKLISEVVSERRRAFEWLLSNEKDWFKISLNA